MKLKLLGVQKKSDSYHAGVVFIDLSLCQKTTTRSRNLCTSGVHILLLEHKARIDIL